MSLLPYIIDEKIPPSRWNYTKSYETPKRKYRHSKSPGKICLVDPVFHSYMLQGPLEIQAAWTDRWFWGRKTSADTGKSGVAIKGKLTRKSFFFSPVRVSHWRKDAKWHPKLSSVSLGMIIASDLSAPCMKTIRVLVWHLLVIFWSLQNECKDVEELALKI